MTGLALVSRADDKPMAKWLLKMAIWIRGVGCLVPRPWISVLLTAVNHHSRHSPHVPKRKTDPKRAMLLPWLSLSSTSSGPCHVHSCT
ncbi:hypothetical protein HZ326_17924 [Fusarium oxysporum f. sp. albedinis]|nr:hypothetical protein HZ326_17924 [Fusarium oxysporum f. sp. albedinis]